MGWSAASNGQCRCYRCGVGELHHTFEEAQVSPVQKHRQVGPPAGGGPGPGSAQHTTPQLTEEQVWSWGRLLPSACDFSGCLVLLAQIYHHLTVVVVSRKKHVPLHVK